MSVTPLLYTVSPLVSFWTTVSHKILRLSILTSVPCSFLEPSRLLKINTWMYYWVWILVSVTHVWVPRATISAHHLFSSSTVSFQSALTKWGWAAASVTIQTHSLINTPSALSTTTTTFYYSVKWGLKDDYGNSYLTMQSVSLVGRGR